MEPITIPRDRYNRIVSLTKWAEKCPPWFDAGDRLWERISDMYRELIEGIEPDPTRYEYTHVIWCEDELYLTVYDMEECDNIDILLVAVDV